MFMVDVDNNLKIGCFINDKLFCNDYNEIKIPNSFLFTYKNNEMKTFKPKHSDVTLRLSQNILDFSFLTPS